MPDTQEKLLSVEEAQDKVREESVYTADTDETPVETEEPTTEEEVEDEPEKEPEVEDPEKETEDEPEEESETDVEEEPEKETVKFKYKSQEEAEAGAKEAERKMHEKAEEARVLREEVESFKKNLKKSVEDGELTKKEGASLKNIFIDMLQNIDDLDSSDESYREKLAEIWANGLGEGLSIQEQERIARMKEEQAKEEENRSIVEQANTLAKSAGLDMDFIRDEKGKPVSTIDYDLFWAIVAKSQPVGETVEDRINWVVNEVKKKRTDDRERIINQQKILSEKQKKAQDKNKVLEKGVKIIPDKTKDEAPLSMAEALSRIERRV